MSKNNEFSSILKMMFIMMFLPLIFGFETKDLICPNAHVDDYLASVNVGQVEFGCKLHIAGGNGLYGQISGEAIRNISLKAPSLSYFLLSFNWDLNGTIPTEFGLLTALNHLFLNGNALTGSIPDELFHLTLLKELVLDHNALDTLPDHVTALPGLTNLDLSFNYLSGSLSRELFKLSSLESMDISGNNFGGRFPSEIQDVGNLRSLNIRFNTFTGTLPLEIFSLTNLESLDIYYNQFEGTFPTEIALLTRLTHLFIKPNNFVGTMPFFDNNTTNSDTYPGEVFPNMIERKNKLPRDQVVIIVASTLGGVFLVTVGISVVLALVYNARKSLKFNDVAHG